MRRECFLAVAQSNCDIAPPVVAQHWIVHVLTRLCYGSHTRVNIIPVASKGMICMCSTCELVSAGCLSRSRSPVNSGCKERVHSANCAQIEQ
jgi:hypothetical protein